jgi:hypothetical protein
MPIVLSYWPVADDPDTALPELTVGGEKNPLLIDCDDKKIVRRYLKVFLCKQ